MTRFCHIPLHKCYSRFQLRGKVLSQNMGLHIFLCVLLFCLVGCLDQLQGVGQIFLHDPRPTFESLGVTGGFVGSSETPLSKVAFFNHKLSLLWDDRP